MLSVNELALVTGDVSAVVTSEASFPPQSTRAHEYLSGAKRRIALTHPKISRRTEMSKSILPHHTSLRFSHTSNPFYTARVIKTICETQHLAKNANLCYEMTFTVEKITSHNGGNVKDRAQNIRTWTDARSTQTDLYATFLAYCSRSTRTKCKNVMCHQTLHYVAIGIRAESNFPFTGLPGFY